MLVTVAIPSYNGELYIGEALRGILRQTYKDFECLVVDDCSKDATRRIVASFNDPRITVIKNKNRLGVYKNFNQCLSLAKGKYVFLNHQDDIMLPELLERALPILESDPDIACLGINPFVIDAEGVRGGPFFTYTEQDVLFSGESFLDSYFQRYSMAISSVLLRKDVLDTYKLRFDAKDGESADMVFWVRLALRAKKLFFMNEHLFLRRIHTQQASAHFGKGVDSLQEYILKPVSAIFQLIACSALEMEKRREYCNVLLYQARECLTNMPCSQGKAVEKKFRAKILGSLALLETRLADDVLAFME